jgi:hypothetical protein
MECNKEYLLVSFDAVSFHMPSETKTYLRLNIEIYL